MRICPYVRDAYAYLWEYAHILYMLMLTYGNMPICYYNMPICYICLCSLMGICSYVISAYAIGGNMPI